MQAQSYYTFYCGTTLICVFLGKWSDTPPFAITHKTTYRETIQKYLKDTEPEKVAARIGNGLICHTFYAAGVNHFWAMDQHDKWKHFGLFLHGCIDGFTGKILWLVIWWTNSNLKFVCSQYLKAIKAVGSMFLFISSCILHCGCI